MKNFVLIFMFFVSCAFVSNAQKIVVVDMNQIMDSQADYKRAQDDLEKVSTQWRQEVSQEQDKLKSMYNKYQAEQVLLNEEQRKQREEEILKKEGDIRDMQKKKFGPEGDLFVKRQELVKPIQDRVFNEIEKYCAEKGYEIILDKTNTTGIVFVAKAVDKTDELLKRLKK